LQFLTLKQSFGLFIKPIINFKKEKKMISPNGKNSCFQPFGFGSIILMVVKVFFENIQKTGKENYRSRKEFDSAMSEIEKSIGSERANMSRKYGEKYL